MSTSNQYNYGSVFASSIAQSITRGWLSEDDHDDLTEVQGISLSALDSAIHRTLLEIHCVAVSSRYGGSIEAMRSLVFTMGNRYMESNASTDDASDNHEIGGLLRDIHSGKTERPEDLESALSQLEYWMSLMTAVDRYLELMDVPYPDGQQCYEWNESESYKWKSPESSAISEMLRERCDVMFPHPVQIQGRWFTKGISYVAVALIAAGLSKDIIQHKLDVLVAIIDREVQEQARIVKVVPEVKTKRQKLLQALGKVGNMSQ